MKRLDWQRLLPLGIDSETALTYARRALLLAMAWSLKAPFAAMLSRENMFAYMDNVRVIYRDMESITWVMRGSWYGLVLLAACMPFLALYFYSLHFQGSKSIYTMRRLPKKGELLRRCVTLPCVMAVTALAAIVVLSVVYYGFYVLLTPRGYLLPGQWQLMWEDLLC